MDAFPALLADSIVLPTQDIDIEELVNSFMASCTEILNVVAPLQK